MKAYDMGEYDMEGYDTEGYDMGGYDMGGYDTRSHNNMRSNNMRSPNMRSKKNYVGAIVLRIHGGEVRRDWVLCAVTVFVILTVCILCGGILSFAHGNRPDRQVDCKYYTSIEIQPGDTLWGIAEEYIPADYKSVREYVQALKDMNSLKSDNIEAGQKLTVAYNDIT